MAIAFYGVHGDAFVNTELYNLQSLGQGPGRSEPSSRLSLPAWGKQGASATCTKHSSKMFISAVEASALLQADEFSPDRTLPSLHQVHQNRVRSCHARYFLMRPFFFFL